MYRPRIIPVLLINNGGVVKTKKFKSPTYIGDPINTVKLFNELKADELIILDISASLKGRLILESLVKKISLEAFMPFAVGGGVRDIDDAKKLFDSGAEKIVINTNAFINKNLITNIANKFGRQSVIASIDVKKNWNNKYKIYTKSGKKKQTNDLVETVKKFEKMGAGEIIINSIDKDGTRSGYDIELINLVSDSVSVPTIACGGAASHQEIIDLLNTQNCSAAAAGNVFVFIGEREGVLVNYIKR